MENETILPKEITDIDQLPDGKTILPGSVIINKMGKSIILQFEIKLEKAIRCIKNKNED